MLFYAFAAAKSLKQAGMSVYKPLKNGDVDGARKSVLAIVGRDTESLDDIGITKAAVETVAENTSDGVIAGGNRQRAGVGSLQGVNTMGFNDRLRRNKFRADLAQFRLIP